MSDTDTTLAMTAQSPRPSALGDLRFAGTIATGLVAGTLGLGALAAPLVGWKNWPEGLGKDAASQPVRLASPVLHQPSNGARESGRNGGGNGGAPVQPGPGGAAPLLVSVPTGTDGATGPLPLAPIGGPSAPRTSSGGGDDAGGLSTTARPRSGKGEFKGVPFRPVDNNDDDADGLPNDWERRVANTDATVNDADAKTPGGVSNATDYKVRIMSLPGWDTNGNGIVDAEDDADGDGIPNGIEERNGSNPASADTDGDGIPDTMDDRDGDGWPDGLPKPPVPVDEPPVVEEPPTIATPEPTPTPEQTPPVEETPAPPVEETPAPTPAPVETPTPPAEPTPTPEQTPTPEPTPTATPETEPAPEPTPPAATAASAPVEETPAPTPAPVETPAAPAPTPEAPAPTPAPAQEAPAAATPAPTEQPAEDPAATPAW